MTVFLVWTFYVLIVASPWITWMIGLYKGFGTVGWVLGLLDILGLVIILMAVYYQARKARGRHRTVTA